jgi:hypothetical protein
METRKCPKCDGKGGRPKAPRPGDPLHHGPMDLCPLCNGTGSLAVPDGWGEIEADEELPICLHCGREMTGPDPDRMPKLEDEAGWEAEAGRHAPDCEWVRTRAFRRDEP